MQTMMHERNYGPYTSHRAKVITFQKFCNRADNKVETYSVVDINNQINRSRIKGIGNYPMTGCMFGHVDFTPSWINEIKTGDEINLIMDNKNSIYFGFYSLLDHLVNIALGFIFFCCVLLFKRKAFQC